MAAINHGIANIETMLDQLRTIDPDLVVGRLAHPQAMQLYVEQIVIVVAPTSRIG